MKIIKYFTCLICLTSFQLINPQNISWEKTEGPYGGYISALYQSSTGKIYAGGHGILFMRNSNEESWTVAVRTNTNSEANTIVENSQGEVFASFGTGTYRSSDNGVSWELMNSGISGLRINKLSVDDQNNLYTTAVISDSLKIFKSIDNGISWFEIYQYSPAGDDYSIIQSGDNGLILIGYYYQIFRSTNYGQSWGQNTYPTFGRINCFHIKENGIIYGTESGPPAREIWKSTDYGVSWFVISVTTNYGNPTCIESDSAQNLFLGLTNGILKSTDDGASWIDISFNLSNQQVLSIELNNEQKILIGTYATGVFEFSQINSTWIEKNNNMSDFIVTSIVINSENTVWVGTSWNGIHYSKNGISNWKEYSDGLDRLTAYEIKFSKRDELFLADYAGLFKFNDVDSTWNIIWTPSWGRGTSIEVKDYDTLIVGTWDDGIPVSYDNGQNWFFRYVYSRWERASSIKMLSNRKVIVGCDGGNVYITSDNFVTWSRIFYPSGLFDVSDVEQSSNGNLLFSLKSHTFGTPVEGRLYISSDEGQTWENIVDSIGNPYIYCIKPHTNNRIFIGTAEGIYLTTDYGNNWQQLNAGLDNLYIRSLAIDNYGYIYAGTEEGVYRSTSNIVTYVQEQEIEIPRNFSLSQNYPNPFNPITKIKFTIPNTSLSFGEGLGVRLIFYDILGNEIVTLVDEEKPAGSYEVEFNATNLPSGVYFYQIQAGNFVETNKMILLK